MRGLKLEAQAHSKLEYFYYCLFSELLNSYFFFFISIVWVNHEFELVHFIDAHLLVKEHWIHVVCTFVKSGLLYSTSINLNIYNGATFPTAFPLEIVRPYQMLLLQYLFFVLACIASVVFLRHLPPLCLALFNNVHSNIHTEVFLDFIKFMFYLGSLC